MAIVSGLSAPKANSLPVPRDSSDAQQLGKALDDLNDQVRAARGLVIDLTGMLFGAQAGVEKEVKGAMPIRDGLLTGAIDKTAVVYDLAVDVSQRLSEIINRLRL